MVKAAGRGHGIPAGPLAEPALKWRFPRFPGRILADSANPSMQALRGNYNFQLSSPEDAFVVARFALLTHPGHLLFCIIDKSAGMPEKEDDTGEIEAVSFFIRMLVIPVVANTIYQCALSCQKMGILGLGVFFPFWSISCLSSNLEKVQKSN